MTSSENFVDSDALLEKPCPYCGQMLKAGAVVCRFCRRDLFNPDAPPIVAQHDWERETPVERVVFTVRLPVSEAQWRWMCYGLAGAVGVFWFMLTQRKPAPEADWHAPATATVVANSGKTHTSTSLVEDATPAPGSSGHHSLWDDTPSPVSHSENAVSWTDAPTPGGKESSATGNSTPAPTPNDAGASATTMASSTKDASRPTGNTLTATQIITMYDNSPDLAEQRYTHQTVQITGTVIGVGTGADKSPFISLKGVGDTNIKCLFTSSKGKAGPATTMGSEVTISGTCEGRYVDLLLTDCQMN